MSDKTAQLQAVFDKISVRGMEALPGISMTVSYPLPPSPEIFHIAMVTKEEIWQIDELLQVIVMEVNVNEINK